MPFSSSDGALTIYDYRGESVCHPAICPEPGCGEQVYFIRHNGGSVWVDPPLGWPWPKHRHCNDSESDVCRFITDAGSRYADLAVKAKLGRVIKRIYQHSFCIYLVATHEGKLCALRTKRSERMVFTDIVTIRYNEDAIHLEDSRHLPLAVKNFKMTIETMQEYLGMADHIIHITKQRSEPPLINVVWCISRQKWIPK